MNDLRKNLCSATALFLCAGFTFNAFANNNGREEAKSENDVDLFKALFNIEQATNPNCNDFPQCYVPHMMEDTETKQDIFLIKTRNKENN